MNKYHYEDDDDKHIDKDELEENYDVENDDDDDDYSYNDDQTYYQKKKKRFHSHNDDDSNHPKKETKNESSGFSDIENEDNNLNIIVQAVLDELQNDDHLDNKKKHDSRYERVKNFHDEIDSYLKCNHTRQNSYLSSRPSFQKKLKKLMKSLCEADSRDESIPKFSTTEKTIMKIFYKDKQFDHDMRFMMVENNIYLNILRKMSKYLKKL